MNLKNLLNHDAPTDRPTSKHSTPPSRRESSISNLLIQPSPATSQSHHDLNEAIHAQPSARTYSHDSVQSPSGQALSPTQSSPVFKRPQYDPTATREQSLTSTKTSSPLISNGNSQISKKRPAPDILEQNGAQKRQRHRERPIWARLSPRNSRYNASSNGSTRLPERPPVADRPIGKSTDRQHAAAVNISSARPWLEPIPYDTDLLGARKILGRWEKSMRWNTPYPDLLRALQDWLLENLQAYEQVAKDTSKASFEVEAKVGTLLKTQTNDPVALPVLNMTLLRPSVNQDYRFESELDEADFKNLNNFLNETLVESRQPGREAMQYTRTVEVDSFSEPSPKDIAALPPELPAATKHGREIRVRTTRTEDGRVTARIVKTPIAHIHIYNPRGYDCRLSLNVETNLLRPDLNPAEPAASANSKHALHERKKDRLSYKHLAYQADLTRVMVSGMGVKYELEVEVDAGLLLQQSSLMRAGQPHAFGDVVSGFLDNVQFLMRQHVG